jgi:hypothetical protein
MVSNLIFKSFISDFKALSQKYLQMLKRQKYEIYEW